MVSRGLNGIEVYVIDPIFEQKIDNYTEEVKKRNINEYKIKDS